MTLSDPIEDMLTRIRNANTAKHDTVDVPSSVSFFNASSVQSLLFK